MNTDTCPDCSNIPCDCGLPAGYTPTPRTDAFAKSIDQSNFEDSWKDDFEEFAWVTADFARQLETELAAVTKQRDEAREQRDRLAFKLLMATVGEPNSSADHCWVSEEDNF